MLAYVRDYELHVLNLLCNKSKQLTFGADDNVLVSFSFTFPYILAGLLSSCLHIRYYQQHYKVQIETKASLQYETMPYEIENKPYETLLTDAYMSVCECYSLPICLCS